MKQQRGDGKALSEGQRTLVIPNMRDVAARAGVSLSAVSLVVNGKPGVGSDKRSRVMTAMRELGYTPNMRKATPSTHKVFGLLMESLSTPANNDGFYQRIIAGIEHGAYQHGYKLLLHVYRPGVDPLGDIRELMGRDVDGLIIANDGDVTGDVIQHIASMGSPLVLVESYLDAPPIHAVTADNFSAGLSMTKHLIELGHRRIGVICGPAKYSSLHDRLRGYQVALLEHGLSIDPLLQPAPISGQLRKGYHQMQELLALPNPPTAVFAVSDKAAFGAIDAIRDAKLRIPEDISIVGIDDVAESAYQNPPLTTYHVPKHKLGETAVRVMEDILHANIPPVRILVSGSLVLRASTAAPHSKHPSIPGR